MKPVLWHKCEDNIMRPYPSMLCTHCNTPKTTNEHFVKVIHYTAIEKDLNDYMLLIKELSEYNIVNDLEYKIDYLVLWAKELIKNRGH